MKLTKQEKEEAMMKAFELFAICMNAGPCNYCPFYSKDMDGDPCKIGYPNSWSLFDSEILGDEGRDNRQKVLKALDKMDHDNRWYLDREIQKLETK